jgi:hypothetical protein
MSESFDDQLINKIRNTFENYIEPFNEDAWVLMKQKLSDKKRRKFILFFDISKAASVILIIGFSIFYPYRNDNRIWTGKRSGSVADNSKEIRRADMHSVENYANLNSVAKSKHQQFKPKNINTKIIIPENITEDQIAIQNEAVDSILESPENLYVNVFNDHITDTSSMLNEKDSVIDNRPILLPEDDDFIKHKKSDKKFNIGIAVSSYYSSSDIGATDNISIGGGVQTEYAISDLISFNTGVLLTDHNLNTSGQNVFKQALGQPENGDHAIAGDVKKEIKLIGLDIPLNISFKFDKFFITSGISSLVYLKESYSENYYVEDSEQVYNPVSGVYETVNMYDKVNNSEHNGAFQTFDFAKLINFSIGYSIQLKNGKLIFEPFAKIPIGDMTEYNISYGYGGVSLRYDF